MTGRRVSDRLDGRARSEVAAECVDRYRAGATLREIALATGVGVDTV